MKGYEQQTYQSSENKLNVALMLLSERVIFARNALVANRFNVSRLMCCFILEALMTVCWWTDYCWYCFIDRLCVYQQLAQILTVVTVFGISSWILMCILSVLYCVCLLAATSLFVSSCSKPFSGRIVDVHFCMLRTVLSCNLKRCLCLCEFIAL